MEDALRLPKEYHEILRIDPQKDRKRAHIVNALSSVITVVLLMLGHRIVPLTLVFTADNPALIAVRLLTIAAGAILCLLLHEPIHGIFMEKLSSIRTKYGFTGICAYAESEAFFYKRSYLIILLAPAVIWGIILTLFCVVMPDSVFWVAFMGQVANLASAAGDLYIAWIVLRMPDGVLVQDMGTSLAVYGTGDERKAG